MEKLREILRNRGINPSYQRIKIFEYLRDNKLHPTVDMIYERLSPEIPTLSKTTIYNTLKLFAEKGMVSLLVIDQAELRVDPNIVPHAHFICSHCGKIYDIDIDESSLKEIEGRASYEGHRIESIQVALRGICKNCMSKAS